MVRKILLMFSMILALIAFTGCAEKNTTVSGNIQAAMTGSEVSADSLKVQGVPIDASTVIITDTVVDIFTDPDVKSERITQALFNQPAKVLEEKVNWVKLLTSDGSIGWTRSKYVDKDISSIYGKSFTHKIIITSKEKNIYSDPSGGITLKDVAMGTELYTFNDSGAAYEVYLPGNTTGWLKGSGMIHVDLNSDTPLTTSEDFAASALKFKGTSYLLGGVSSLGIDSAGMTYICARVNGINIPREFTKLKETGTKVSMNETIAGDLVFLTGNGDIKTITSVGINVGNGQFIYASRSLGYVKLEGLNDSGSDVKPAFAVRIFR